MAKSMEPSNSRLSPPRSISPQAQAALAGGVPHELIFPDPDDVEGWKRHIAEVNAQLPSAYSKFENITGETRSYEIDGVPVVATGPPEPIGGDRRIILDVHGGALIYAGGATLDPYARMMAGRTQANIVSLDYRMPPMHPYPAGLDDCVKVYRSLVENHGAENIIVLGTSSGGNQAAALVIRARDEGIALPAGLILLTPELDLTESGDTFQTLLGVDLLGSLMDVNCLYAAGAPLDHPYLSPLFGDFTKGFPPTFLQSGTRDLFLSNTVRMHRALRKADVPVELHVWEAMPHGAFTGSTPEDLEVNVEVRKFIRSIWTWAS